jgi:hypothetical protein
MGYELKSSLDFMLSCAIEWMKPFGLLLFYLPVLAVSHCCLFLEFPMRLCSCAVVLYKALPVPPNLVTVTLHYFLTEFRRLNNHETGANQNLFSGFSFKKTVPMLLFYTPVDEAVVSRS